MTNRCYYYRPYITVADITVTVYAVAVTAVAVVTITVIAACGFICSHRCSMTYCSSVTTWACESMCCCLSLDLLTFVQHACYHNFYLLTTTLTAFPVR